MTVILLNHDDIQGIWINVVILPFELDAQLLMISMRNKSTRSCLVKTKNVVNKRWDKCIIGNSDEFCHK